MKLLLTFFILFNVGAVLGTRCTWHPTIRSTDYEYCTWGCCYTYSYPCCSRPYYDGTPFKLGMGVGVAALLLGAIVSGICYRRRRITATTVQQTNTGNQNVFSTSTSINVNSTETNTAGNNSFSPPAYSTVTASPAGTNSFSPPAYNTLSAYSNQDYVKTY